MSTSNPTPVPALIEQLADSVRHGEDARAVRMDLETLVDLCHRLHTTAITYRDIAGLNPTNPEDQMHSNSTAPVTDAIETPIGEVLTLVENTMVEYDHQSYREFSGASVLEDFVPIQAAIKKLWLAEREAHS